MKALSLSDLGLSPFTGVPFRNATKCHEMKGNAAFKAF